MLPLITRAVALSFLALLRWRNSLLRIRFARLAFPGSMDGRAAIEPGAAVRERSCPTNRPLLLNPERLVSFPIRDGVHVQVSVRWQAMDEELEREADCLRRIISGVISRAESIEVYVRRNSIAESREEIIVRTGTVVAGEETLRGQHRIDSGWEEGRAVLREILCAQAGANFVFKTLVAGEPGNRYRGKAVLLGAEVSALPEGKEAQILLVVHSGDVDAKAQALCNHKVESCVAGDLPVIRNVLSRDVRAADGSVYRPLNSRPEIPGVRRRNPNQRWQSIFVLRRPHRPLSADQMSRPAATFQTETLTD